MDESFLITFDSDTDSGFETHFVNNNGTCVPFVKQRLIRNVNIPMHLGMKCQIIVECIQGIINGHNFIIIKQESLQYRGRGPGRDGADAGVGHSTPPTEIDQSDQTFRVSYI